MSLSAKSLPVMALALLITGNALAQAQPVPPKDGAVPVPGDHYQCYRVIEGRALKPELITVSDQFSSKTQLVLARPVMLCNPSNKLHNGIKYGVEFKQRHLVCYEPIKQSDQPVKRRVHINNQFAPDELTTAERQMFCVPSSKYLIGAPDKPID
jgi:hypothetical protein